MVAEVAEVARHLPELAVAVALPERAEQEPPVQLPDHL
jgi:hypothetical protein